MHREAFFWVWRQIQRLVIAFALLNAVGAFQPLWAADLRPVVAEILLELRYDGPPPDITWVHARDVVEVCGCKPGASRPWAIYRDSTVYVSEALDMGDLFERSILVHELVHHIQWVSRGPAEDCHEWQRRELAATAAQNAWLAERGSPRRAIFTGVCR